MVKAFYEKAPKDEVIGAFFTDVVELNMEIHLPKIVNFWSSLLLDLRAYKGNPMIKHIELSRKRTLESRHFERWLELWRNTVDEHYIGPNAEKAKSKAFQIGELMMYKIRDDSRFGML